MNRYLFLARGVEAFMLYADDKRAALSYGLEQLGYTLADARKLGAVSVRIA